MAYLDDISNKRQAFQLQDDDVSKQIQHQKELLEVKQSIKSVSDVISQAIYRKSNIVKVDNFPTSINTPDMVSVVNELKTLRKELADKTEPEDVKSHDLLSKLIVAMDKLPKEYAKAVEFPKEFAVNNQKDYTKAIKDVVDAVKAIKMDFNPKIEVKPADVTVNNDFATLEKKMEMVEKAIKAISIVIPENDDSVLLSAINKTTKAINSLSFPVPNYVLPFKNVEGAASQIQLNTDGTLPVANNQLPTAGNNPSYTLDTVTVGLVHTLTLTKTIDGTVYTKTTVIDTSDNSITESAWV